MTTKREQLIVVQDTREKKPLLFPSTFEWTDYKWMNHLVDIVVETRRIEDGGDYYIDGYGDIIRIERKGSVRELFGNLCTKDSKRAMKAFTKFQNSCQYPLLLLDESLTRFYRESVHHPPPTQIHDLFYREMACRGIQLLWLPCPATVAGRRQVGDALIRIMWAHIFMEKLRHDSKVLYDRPPLAPKEGTP